MCFNIIGLQMSFWGYLNLAQNVCFIFQLLYLKLQGCLDFFINIFTTIWAWQTYFFDVFSDKPEIIISFTAPFNIGRIKANKRIGPHDKDILSIIFGGLLGDAHAEKRSTGKGTRISFYQEGSHISYLIWLHQIVSELGYCNPVSPELQTRLGSKGIVRKIIRFHTFTFSSFNWIHELWYDKNIKKVPCNIYEFLTPISLAIWIMDDGGKVGNSLKLSTNSFTYSDCLLLVKTLYENFKVKATIQSAGVPNQYCIYILTESMPSLREIVSSYVHPSMKYKIGLK